MKQTYQVTGMDCASCGQIITNKISKLPGVISCEVNFVSKHTSIDFDPKQIGFDTLNEEAGKYGYGFVDMSDSYQKQDDMHHMQGDDNLKKARNNVLISIVLTSLSVGIMVWMIGNDYSWRARSEVLYEFFHHLLPIFATIMLFIVGWKYVVAVARYIRYGVANMDTLVGIGTIVAFLYSFIVAGFEESLSPYLDVRRSFYETVIIVIGFIEIGKYMETKVMSRTGEAIKALLGLQAKNALIIQNGEEVQISLEQVQLGDVMIVKPGEKVPLDGKIISGTADVDESMITGESMPVLKIIDDLIIGSTIVSNSTLQVQVTALGKDTYLSKIIAIVEQAQNSKPQIQKFADQIMTYFVPSILLIAIGAGLFWLFLGNQFFPDINAVRFALMSFVGVLVIACPCGLGLATPMAIVMGVGHGAKNGILAKNAEGLLKLRKSKIVVFDKTGTITEGKPKLVEIKQIQDPKSKTQNNLNHLSILASLESLSSHPIAYAIVEYAKAQNIGLSPIHHFKNLEGIGLQGEIDGKMYTVCKPGYLDTEHIGYDAELIHTRTSQGKTPLILLEGGEIIGYYAVADSIKESSAQAITALKKLGMVPIMLTGDHANTANYIASQLGIEKVYAEVKPEQKAQIIAELKLQGMVTMIGDGINDAPALVTADIGIAMSTGTDVAIESADITLLHGDLSKLVKAIRISQLTHNAIWQNLARAFGFNLIGVPLAAGAFYPLFGILLNPAFEGAAMAFSNLTVVGNSLRFQAKKI